MILPATGLAALALGAAAAPASAATSPAYASPDAAPPALTVPEATMAAALTCSPGIANATRTPVLLVPATGVTPEQNYDWNYELAFAKQGIPFCTIELPEHTLGDIQTAGEYVTFAIRRMHLLAGRKISIIGHSQGGMVFRWAFRFFKDTRPMVDDAIGFAGSNHGTDLPSFLVNCATIGCPAATQQQASTSRFITALNSDREAFEGISYTNIRTRNDEVVVRTGVPDDQASPYLHDAKVQSQITNVAIQDVCPADQSEHLLVGTTSNTAYALAMDALTHPGPANPERAKAAACAQPIMPGVDPANLDANVKALQAVPGLVSVAGVNLVGVPLVTKEPALKPYVFASSATTAPAKARQRVTVTPRRFRAGRTVTVRVRVRSSAGGAVKGQRVRLLGETARTNAKGRASLRVKAAKAGVRTLRSTGNGLAAKRVRVRVLRAR